LGERIKVSLYLERVSIALKDSGKTYVTVKHLAEILGTSTKTAGKIMSKLEALGHVEKYSRKAYRIRY
jgi:Mn-dependent DtxR family transcriptional regulator